jgi:hypothetical protein
MNATSELRAEVKDLYKKTKYDDLEHAELGLEILMHAVEEAA